MKVGVYSKYVESHTVRLLYLFFCRARGRGWRRFAVDFDRLWLLVVLRSG